MIFLKIRRSEYRVARGSVCGCWVFVFPRPISQTRPISDGHPYRDKWQPSGRLPLIWAGLNFHLLTASSYCTFPVKLLALARLSIEMSLRAEFLRFDRLLMSRRHQVVQSQVLHHLPVVIPRV